MNPENNVATGAKYDLGKNLAGLPYEDFPLAILAVAQVGTFGCKKYVRNSWKTVPELQIRYKDALHRHLLADASGQKLDEESGLPHLAHAAWNILALLQDRIDCEVLQAQPKPAPQDSCAPNSPAGPMYLALVAENAKLRAELDTLRWQQKTRAPQATTSIPSKYLLTAEDMQAIGDLLAVINCDGGHLQERVGMYNAAKQAIQQVHDLQAAQAMQADPAKHSDNCGCNDCFSKQYISPATPYTQPK